MEPMAKCDERPLRHDCRPDANARRGIFCRFCRDKAKVSDHIVSQGLTPNGTVKRIRQLRRVRIPSYALVIEYHEAHDPHSEVARSANSRVRGVVESVQKSGAARRRLTRTGYWWVLRTVMPKRVQFAKRYGYQLAAAGAPTLEAIRAPSGSSAQKSRTARTGLQLPRPPDSQKLAHTAHHLC